LTARHFISVAALVAASTAVPVRADVYAWRDKAGRLVVSDRPGGPGAQTATYALKGSDAVLSTRPEIGGLDRASLHAIADRHAADHAVSPALVRAVIQAESAWNVRAVSPKGALGLMQLMPATATDLGVTNPFDPEQNIRGGVKY
jgi:soluble lytic murein transglycosylase-like protein